MAKDPFLSFIKEVTDTSYELERLSRRDEERKARLKALENSPKRDLIDFGRLFSSDSLLSCDSYFLEWRINSCTLKMTMLCCQNLTSLISEEEQLPRIGGRRIADAVVVSAVVLLSFVYHYLVGYIDRGGSKAGSSSSLDFRDIYISIVLFQAAYVWIKFRDVIPPGAVYRRRNSDKWEPRIKYPVTRGVGCKSKRIPLGSFDTEVEAEVAYRIAAFYCNKLKHTGRLDLEGGAYFRIPALSVDPNLPYEEKREQVRVQVLKVYAQFEEQKANSGLDSATQGPGSQPTPIVDFNNPSPAMLAKTQSELLEAREEIKHLNAQVSEMEFENMRWEVKYSDLERENGQLKDQVMQSQPQPPLQELDSGPDIFLNMEHEESLAR